MSNDKLYDAFRSEMAGKDYGTLQRDNAFHFFVSGWVAAQKELQQELARESADSHKYLGLLVEAKYMLQHTRCNDDYTDRCPACGLESRIDALLGPITE